MISLGNFGFSEAIALIAVIVAFYYGWQNSKLTKRLIAKEESEVRKKSKADLGANFVKLGNNSYRLKVFNRGNADARNVRIEAIGEDNCLNQRDVDSKFPHERLEPQQGVELIAHIHIGSQSKHPLKLMWDDDFKIGNEKTVYPTI